MSKSPGGPDVRSTAGKSFGSFRPVDFHVACSLEFLVWHRPYGCRFNQAVLWWGCRLLPIPGAEEPCLCGQGISPPDKILLRRTTWLYALARRWCVQSATTSRPCSTRRWARSNTPPLLGDPAAHQRWSIQYHHWWRCISVTSSELSSSSTISEFRVVMDILLAFSSAGWFSGWGEEKRWDLLSFPMEIPDQWFGCQILAEFVFRGFAYWDIVQFFMDAWGSLSDPSVYAGNVQKALNFSPSCAPGFAVTDPCLEAEAPDLRLWYIDPCFRHIIFERRNHTHRGDFSSRGIAYIAVAQQLWYGWVEVL